MNNIHRKIVDYWNKQPCNIGHSSAEIGTEKFFNDITNKRFFVEPHAATFAQYHLYQNKRVLEIGCGIGTEAAEFVKHGAEYVGIDISENSLALARQRFEIFDLAGQFHLKNAADDLSDLGYFDLVYSYGVIHHYPNEQDVIKQIHNVLKPQGEFKFMVYAKNSWKYAMIRKGLDQYEAQPGCPFAKVYTQEEIFELLNEYFEVKRIRQDHCFMYNVNKYKQNIFELEPWFEVMPPHIIEALKEYLGWHLMVKAIKI